MGAGGALGGARNTPGWTPRTDGRSYASAKPSERLSQTAGFAWAEGQVGGGLGGRHTCICILCTAARILRTYWT